MNRSTFVRLASLTALTLVALILSNCKKSDSSNGNGSGNSGGYYLKFKMNGNAVEYTSDPIAEFSYSSSEGLYECVIAAYKDVNAGAKNDVTITAFSSTAFAANATYDDPQKAYETNGTWIPKAVIFWYDSTGTAYLTAGLLSDSTGYVPLAGVVADGKFTLTELTSTTVKGTFSGTVYRADFATFQEITDGEFYMKRIQ